MPAKIVSEVLVPAIDFPATERFETGMVESEDTTRAITVRRAQSTHVNRVRSAMQRVGAAVSGASSQFFGLDHFHDRRLFRVWLGVEDIDARRAEPRYDQVAALNVRMGSIRAK